jgi:hypothetical protein
MSGKEVAGLQALAQAHGGSLTVNPKTGLPEAGFLDNLLPALIGGAAMVFAPELGLAGLTAGDVGLGVGALGTLATGDLSKGIQAGLGAYGGAGLAGAAQGAGMLGASPQAVTSQVPGAAAATPLEYNPDFGYGNAQDVSINQTVDPNNYSGSTTTAGTGNMATTAAPPPSIGNLLMQNKGYAAAAAAPAIMSALQPKGVAPTAAPGMVRPYTFDYNKQAVANPIGAKYKPGQDTSERLWFQPVYTPGVPYTPVAGRDYAAGGLTSLAAGGGPVEMMSNQNAIGQNTGYPMAYNHTSAFATPWQTPVSENMLTGSGDVNVDPYTGEQKFAAGGISSLGGYASGGNPRLLDGPGDGMSDSIPATIGGKQPARLADGEFVVPADVVSHLGNGSTDAGAKQLYKMMDRIRQQRTGKKRQAPEVNPAKAMPA